MSTEGDDQLKSKRFARLAIIAAFLLALLWPLGSFVGWILGGATAYFIFLTFYYAPRKLRQSYRPEGQRQSQGYTGRASQPMDAKQKNRVVFAIVAVAVVVTALIILGSIVSLIYSTPVEESGSIESADRENLQTNPNDLDALTNIGNQFYAEAQYDSAMAYYDRVLEIDNQNSSAIFNKALVYYQQGNYTKSMEWSRKCVSTHPENVDGYTMVGDNYYVQKNFSEALIWYRQAYDKGAHNPELLNIMAYILDQQNKRTEAIRFYKETLAQDSSLVDIYNRLAELEPNAANKYKVLAERWKK